MIMAAAENCVEDQDSPAAIENGVSAGCRYDDGNPFQ
jgi:hypothetical protein